MGGEVGYDPLTSTGGVRGYPSCKAGRVTGSDPFHSVGGRIVGDPFHILLCKMFGNTRQTPSPQRVSDVGKYKLLPRTSKRFGGGLRRGQKGLIGQGEAVGAFLTLPSIPERKLIGHSFTPQEGGLQRVVS